MDHALIFKPWPYREERVHCLRMDCIGIVHRPAHHTNGSAPWTRPGSVMTSSDIASTPASTEALGEILKRAIRDVPDFPQPGIMFRDISTLLADPDLFRQTIDAMAAPFERIDKVVIVESRGFILGTPIAYAIGAGVVPVRKPGRLPAATFS